MASTRFMKIGLGIGAAVIAGTFAAGIAIADGQDGATGARDGHFAMRMLGLRGLRALNLTQDQKDKIKASLVARRPAFQALRQTARTNRQALATLTKAANPDPAAVGAAYLKVEADRQAFAAQRQQARADVVALLTPDQKTQYQQMQSERGGFHKGPPAQAN